MKQSLSIPAICIYIIAEEKKDVSSSSLQLRGSYTSLSTNHDTIPLLLKPISKVLLGSITPIYLTKPMIVCPSTEQNTLEERDACCADFCSLLDSLNSGLSHSSSSSSLNTSFFVERSGLLLQEENGDGDTCTRNNLYLLVPMDSSPCHIASGMLWSVKKWYEIAPKPPMNAWSTNRSINPMIERICSLPLSTFNPLNQTQQTSK